MVSIGQKISKGSARWFWFGFCHRVAVRVSQWLSGDSVGASLSLPLSIHVVLRPLLWSLCMGLFGLPHSMAASGSSDKTAGLSPGNYSKKTERWYPDPPFYGKRASSSERSQRAYQLSRRQEGIQLNSWVSVIPKVNKVVFHIIDTLNFSRLQRDVGAQRIKSSDQSQPAEHYSPMG